MALMESIFFPEHSNAQNSSRLFKGLVVVFRIIQLVWLIVVVGFAGHIVQGTLSTEIDGARSTASSIAIAALIIIIVATIYTLASLVAFWSRTFHFYRGMFLCDMVMCALFLTVSAVLGYMLNPNAQCPSAKSGSSAADATTVESLNQWLQQIAGTGGKDSVIVEWAYSSHAHCVLARALWTSCVCLTVTYLFSGILLGLSWRNDAKGRPSEKGAA